MYIHCSTSNDIVMDHDLYLLQQSRYLVQECYVHDTCFLFPSHSELHVNDKTQGHYIRIDQLLLEHIPDAHAQYLTYNNHQIKIYQKFHVDLVLLIGASLSEPHINGTPLREVYACMYGTTVTFRIILHACSNLVNCKFTLVHNYTSTLYCNQGNRASTGEWCISDSTEDRRLVEKSVSNSTQDQRLARIL